MERLDRLVNKYEKGQIQHVDWLDHLTFNAVELLANKEKECKRNGSLYPSLVVDFCNFAQSDYRVVLQVNITSPLNCADVLWACVLGHKMGSPWQLGLLPWRPGDRVRMLCTGDKEIVCLIHSDATVFFI